MKRYLVFAGPDYYPHGGWEEFKSSHSDKQSAKHFIYQLFLKALKNQKSGQDDGYGVDWAQVVDSKHEKLIKEYTLWEFEEKMLAKKKRSTN